MLQRAGPTGSQFAATFPERFTAALDEARGAMAAIAASGPENGGLIPSEALQRLHEIYRLRVELEIETAGVLWRAAEVVCALTDAVETLNRRARTVPPPPGRWLGGVARGVVERRRSRIAMQDDSERRQARWPDFGAPLTTAPPEGQQMASPDGDGQWPAWTRDPAAGPETEAA